MSQKCVDLPSRLYVYYITDKLQKHVVITHVRVAVHVLNLNLSTY